MKINEILVEKQFKDIPAWAVALGDPTHGGAKLGGTAGLSSDVGGLNPLTVGLNMYALSGLFGLGKGAYVLGGKLYSAGGKFIASVKQAKAAQVAVKAAETANTAKTTANVAGKVVDDVVKPLTKAELKILKKIKAEKAKVVAARAKEAAKNRPNKITGKNIAKVIRKVVAPWGSTDANLLRNLTPEARKIVLAHRKAAEELAKRNKIINGRRQIEDWNKTQAWNNRTSAQIASDEAAGITRTGYKKIIQGSRRIDDRYVGGGKPDYVLQLEKHGVTAGEKVVANHTANVSRAASKVDDATTIPSGAVVRTTPGRTTTSAKTGNVVSNKDKAEKIAKIATDKANKANLDKKMGGGKFRDPSKLVSYDHVKDYGTVLGQKLAKALGNPQ